MDIAEYLNGGDDFIGGGACLADKTISFPRFTLVLPFSLLCPWFDILGNVIVALASLVGARIITRV